MMFVVYLLLLRHYGSPIKEAYANHASLVTVCVHLEGSHTYDVCGLPVVTQALR